MADERVRELERAWRASSDPSDAERLLAEHARTGTTMLALARRIVELERSLDVLGRTAGFDALSAMSLREARARVVSRGDLVGLHAPPPCLPLGEPCPRCTGMFSWSPAVSAFTCTLCNEARPASIEGFDLIRRSPVARLEDLLDVRDPFDGELRSVQEPQALLLRYEGRWYPVAQWQEDLALDRSIEVLDPRQASSRPGRDRCVERRAAGTSG